MKIIGITGPIGCGKSYVADIFREFGIDGIDTDKIYHELTSEYSDTVRALEVEFGKAVVSADGSLNRKTLGEIVFNSPEKLKRLNEITHKSVTDKALAIINEKRAQGCKALVVEVPLMFESGFDKLCDEVVCVAADEQTRIERIVKRNGFSAENAKKRIKNQKDIDFYIANSSKVVYNNNCSDVRAQVKALIDGLSIKN